MREAHSPIGRAQQATCEAGHSSGTKKCSPMRVPPQVTRGTASADSGAIRCLLLCYSICLRWRLRPNAAHECCRKMHKNDPMP
jgi:hypothetical protein